MSSCISDSVKLDQTRFVDKAKDKAPDQSFWIGSLESKSAKKMVEFSYSMQEQLAQQELDRLSSVAKIDFDAEKRTNNERLLYRNTYDDRKKNSKMK